MDINRKIAITILEYLDSHPDFYFPFLVMCREYSPEDDDFVEIEPNEWRIISDDDSYKTFQLWESFQNLHSETIELMSIGFIEKITNESLKNHIGILAKNYRKEWREELWESENIEEFGLNEFIGGKADAFEDCLYLIEKYQNTLRN